MLYEASPEPNLVLEDCHFYHCMDIPGVGPVQGDWDLRDSVDQYLGHLPLDGKAVLEVGPASGFLTFSMEAKGAEVVCVELDPDLDWDHLPDAARDHAFLEGRRAILERMRNGFWFAHERFGSRARVYYGHASAIPEDLGQFDVGVMASVLLHLRDPLAAVQGCASRCRSVVIADIHCPELDGGALMRLRKEREPETLDTWWDISPELLRVFLKSLGFERFDLTFSLQSHVAGEERYDMPIFTLVAGREA